jgi:hypothetical protein
MIVVHTRQLRRHTPEPCQVIRIGTKSTRAGCLRCKPHKHQAERHRGRARSDRRWHEQQVAADHDGYRDRSEPAE